LKFGIAAQDVVTCASNCFASEAGGQRVGHERSLLVETCLTRPRPIPVIDEGLLEVKYAA